MNSNSNWLCKHAYADCSSEMELMFYCYKHQVTPSSHRDKVVVCSGEQCPQYKQFGEYIE